MKKMQFHDRSYVTMSTLGKLSGNMQINILYERYNGHHLLCTIKYKKMFQGIKNYHQKSKDISKKHKE